MSSSVTVGCDRAVLIGIMQIVTSAVRVLFICFFAMAEPWSCRVTSQLWLHSFGVHCSGISKTVLASFGVVGIAVASRCQADALDDNPPRASPTESLLILAFSVYVTRIRYAATVQVDDATTQFFSWIDSTCQGTNVALGVWKSRQKFPC